MKVYLTLLLFVISFHVSSQNKHGNKQNLIQGIWKRVGFVNSESDEIEEAFKIIKGTKSLGISHIKDSLNLDFTLSESLEGFQNFREEDVDSINIKTLSSNGKYFTTVIGIDNVKNNGWVDIVYCIVPSYFQCNGDNLSINGGRLNEFSKVDKLPVFTLQLIYYRGKLDKRNYLKEYLNLNVHEIKSKTCVVFAQPDKPLSISLKQGDVVTIIQEKDNWFKVEYGDNENDVGWIRKEDCQ